MNKFYNWLEDNGHGGFDDDENSIWLAGIEYGEEPTYLMLIGYKLAYLLECGYEGELTLNSVTDTAFIDGLIKRYE